MSQESRRQLVQIIALVLLLAALGFSVWYNFLRPQPAPDAAQPPVAARPAADGAAGEQAAQPPQYGTTATQKAVEQTSGDPTKPQAPSTSGVQLDINPSQFKVYALSPPRNPFLREEGWYGEALGKLPGYPELRESGYFDSMDPVLPDVEQYFGAKDWASVKLTREQQPAGYNISGVSQDGKISTSIELTERTEPNVDVLWEADSGIPLSALRTPGWQDRYSSEELAALPGAGETASPETAADGTLGIPHAGGAASAGAGDAISVSGVNFRGPAASALMVYNGKPYLVAEGSVLPTHYQVLAIKPDGVVLLEMRSGDSQWIPLGMPAPAAK